MRSLFALQRPAARCVAATVIAAAAATMAKAEGLSVHAVDTSVVESLAGARDFEESRATVRPAATSIPIVQGRRSGTGSTLQSSAPAPAVSRTPSSEMFTNSKAVLPLLVGDLEPTFVHISRPMAGRSVGARPSLPGLMSSASR